MDIRSEAIVYESNGIPLHGFVAWDAAKTGKRPGVLVVHEWWGADEHGQKRARQLAELGYTALALDMYGHGKIAKTPDEAGKLMTQVLSDPATLKKRFEAGRSRLAQETSTDATRTAAIGFCFGGTVVLEMARAGADLRAVAAFHPGSLDSKNKAREGAVKTKVLVAIGADDPFVSAEQRESFRCEMSSARVEHELVEYPGAKHGFMVEAATERGQKYGLPLAHDAKAERDAWERMRKLFERVLGK
jgi:dienelactone hydrolase